MLRVLSRNRSFDTPTNVVVAPQRRKCFWRHVAVVAALTPDAHEGNRPGNSPCMRRQSWSKSQQRYRFVLCRRRNGSATVYQNNAPAMPPPVWVEVTRRNHFNIAPALRHR